MIGDNTYRNPLVRDGQSQSARNLPALSPDYIKVDERDRDDLISFARQYSKLIQYYDEQNQPSGNWGDFFKKDTQPEEPHYALYLAFTQLFGLLQKDLNTLTERHLNHYYKEILQLKHKPAQADTVHILLELAKNIDQQLIEKGTLLKAGKDALGKDLFYAIDKDIVLNKASVTELKTIFQESFFDQDGKLRKVKSHGIYASPIAASSDGIGADEEVENLSWKLLGSSQIEDRHTMPKAEIGFAISSPILLLKEGDRKIRLEIELEKNLHYDFLPYFMAVIIATKVLNQADVESLQTILLQVTLPADLSEAQKALMDQTGAVLEDHLDEAIAKLPATDPDNETEQLKLSWQALKEKLKKEDPQTGTISIDHRATFDTLRLLMNHHAPKALEKAFIVSLSGVEGWIGPYIIDANYQHGRLLTLEISLTVEDPAIVAYNEKLLEGSFGDSHPLLKIMLNAHDNYQYSILKNLKPTKFKIHVEVAGIKQLVLQNDAANLNPNKKFQPFGPQPNLDNNFYIGSEEAFQKDLSSFKLNIDWADLPDDLQEHYSVYFQDVTAGYSQEIKSLQVAIQELTEKVDIQRNPKYNNHGKGYDFETAEQTLAKLSADLVQKQEKKRACSINAASFKGVFEILNAGKWDNLVSESGDEEIDLFSAKNKEKRVFRLKRPKGTSGEYRRPSTIRDFKKLENDTLEGFIRLKLTEPQLGKFKAFGHQSFQQLYTKRIIEQLKPKNENETIQLPEVPYTPTISAISLDYSSDLTIDISQGQEHHEKVFHIHPFGVAESPLRDTEEQPLTIFPAYQGEGSLFIGLNNLSPSQNLSLLFQLNEKSVDHEFVGKVSVTWSYLRNNAWIDFKDTDILEDSTAIFTQSGIVTFQMPKDITDDNSLFSKGNYWIRATVSENTLGVADALLVQAQAITASFVAQDNDPNHLATPLIAKSIKKLKVSNSAIKAITQAYPSFNGKLKEQDETFYTRVSERLRHKRRSISIWDYEHIILEAFPKVYKVKCLNHYDPEQTPCRREMSPGAVTIVVLSRGEDETEVSRKLAPVTNVITLKAIKDLLKDITPPFIAARNKLFVKNPSYTKIKIDCAVKFNADLDEVYYKRELNTDLMKFFSPWAFDESRDINFERKLYKSLIVNYIEELQYINFVCCFKVLRVDDTGQEYEIIEDIIAAAGPADVLISHHEHQIYPVEGDICNCEDLRKDAVKSPIVVSGIGAMLIETDFTVA